MIITFYKSSAELNLVDKSDKLTIIKTYGNAILKEGTNLINPRILINDISLENNFIEMNYCYIKEFDRYYFVDNVTLARQNIYEFSLSIDILYTVSKDENFWNLNGFIERNEFEYNNYINDEFLKNEAYKDITYTEFQNVGDVDIQFNISNSNWATDNMVLIYTSSEFTDETTSSQQISINALDNLPQVNKFSVGDKMTTKAMVTNYPTMFWLACRFAVSEELSSYVHSLTVYPFTVNNETTTKRNIKIGKTDLSWNNETFSGRGYAQELVHNVDRLVFADIQINNSNDFTDYSPYCEYEFLVPYYGNVKLNGEDILGCRLKFIYLVDYLNATTFLQIYNFTKGVIIFQDTCELGVSLSLNSSNFYEVNKRKDSNKLNAAIGTLSGALQIAAGIGIAVGSQGALAPMGIGLGISGASSIVSSNANAMTQNMTLFTSGKNTIGSGTNGLSNIQKVLLRKIKYRFINRDDEYKRKFGLPLFANKELRNLRGFTKIGEIHLELEYLTKTENEKLESILKSGVIFPNE